MTARNDLGIPRESHAISAGIGYRDQVLWRIKEYNMNEHLKESDLLDEQNASRLAAKQRYAGSIIMNNVMKLVVSITICIYISLDTKNYSEIEQVLQFKIKVIIYFYLKFSKERMLTLMR